MRKLLVIGLLALGTSAAVLPALASSETTPAVEAVGTGPGYYGESYAWSPTQTTLAAGGTVRFSTGNTAAPHGIVWTSSAKPTCASNVPVGENNAAEHWSGTCTFSQPGTYTFHCSVHAEMTGTITVTAAGTTTTTATTPATMVPSPAPIPTNTTTTPAPTTPKPTAGGGGHSGNARKLAKALKACHKRPKGKRTPCEKKARKRYGAKRK
jgi:plastocyanin